MYTTLKQFVVEFIGILEEIDPIYWPKMHLWKGAKKLGRAPLIWTKSKRTAALGPLPNSLTMKNPVY